ncbi:hypothetical protein L210DRAFT_3436152 [Boletus edulis BED1]|uniref:Uncharacterized protein n=1 Tax=Boletus edulis BED1 TaxID=1328754 RepID=A0AAD4G518_BOLED|nr:hypothetical protein L210DRAFT_3436152 [Boletus edulis BED1]
MQLAQVQGGADSARVDDASTLKGEVIYWIATNSERIDLQLSPHSKRDRSLSHNLTGQLLCPVDYDWTNMRTSIQEYDPDFRVTAFSWPQFLYKGDTYNLNEPSKGLFQSDILVKVRCYSISARHHDGGDEAIHFKGPNPRHQSHIAALLRMKSVHPQAIAYIAVQVRFALSCADSWALEDEDFNYETFYYNIVDYFEAPDSPEKAFKIKTLLLWWNRYVRPQVVK